MNNAVRKYILKNKAAAQESLKNNANAQRPLEERIRNYKTRNYERALTSLRDERMRLGVPMNAPYPKNNNSASVTLRNSNRLLSSRSSRSSRRGRRARRTRRARHS